MSDDDYVDSDEDMEQKEPNNAKEVVAKDMEQKEPNNAKEVVAKCIAYYAKDGNSCGGNLHIVLDDGNIEAGCILFCLERCEEKQDKDGIELCNLLLEMSEEERQFIYMHKLLC